MRAVTARWGGWDDALGCHRVGGLADYPGGGPVRRSPDDPLFYWPEPEPVEPPDEFALADEAWKERD